jgi:hypothetical protein
LRSFAQYSRGLLYANATRAIQRFDMRFTADSSIPL